MVMEKSTYRCRKCRFTLFTSNCVINEHVSPSPDDCTQLFISYEEEVLPSWILKLIGESSWLKGKLTCPQCGGRVGSFDFVSASKHTAGDTCIPPIRVLCCRVDRISGQAVRNISTRPASSFRKVEQPQSGPQSDVNAEPYAKENGTYQGQQMTFCSRVAEIQENSTFDDDKTVEGKDGLGNTNIIRDTLSDTSVNPSLIISSSPLFDVPDFDYTGHDRNTDRDSSQEFPRMRRRKRRLRIHEGTSELQTEGTDSTSCDDNGKLNRFSCLDIEENLPEVLEVNNMDNVISEEHSCAVCLDIYCQPMNCIPCQHTFCDPCLRRLARERPYWTPCPLCRVPIKKCLKDYKLIYTLKSLYEEEYKERKRKERKFCDDKFYKLPSYAGSPAQFPTYHMNPRLQRNNRLRRKIVTVVCIIFGILICFAFPMLSNASRILDAAFTLITLIDVIGFIF